MQAVIFFAFFLLVDLFGLADFVVFLGNGMIHVNEGRALSVLIICIYEREKGGYGVLNLKIIYGGGGGGKKKVIKG
jgi:hypothetical protein